MKSLVQTLSGPSVRLDARLSRRDNNLNLIRILAAFAVLVSHAWPMSYGKGVTEPLEASVGLSLGTLAVMVFFAASGYLIAASFDRRTSLGAFVLARAARLVPGLAVSILAVAFLLGPAVTALPLAAYLAHPSTWSFVLRNVTIATVQFDLPGVFAGNPFPVVEGSIWTLKYEVACYIGVVLAGLAGILSRRGMATAVLLAYLVATAAMTAAGLRTFYHLDTLIPLSQPFVLGMLAYLWRDRIPASPALLGGLVLVALAARWTPAYPLVLATTISYATLAAAALPSRLLAAYNRAGDYSYGVYVYAMPMQALAVWLFGPGTPAQNIALAALPTLLLAMLSWHLVEKPALDWAKSRSRRPVPAAAPA